jgi:membrane-bound lytic murein transglycosylase B
MSHWYVFAIQTTLNELGFNAGEPDGFSGPKTRNATRDYQRANNLAVDGYVGYQLLPIKAVRQMTNR